MKVLGVAGIIMVLMFSLSFIPQLFTGPPAAGNNYTGIDNFTVGSVGYSDNFLAVTIPIGTFMAGEPQAESLGGASSFELQAGIFGTNAKETDVNVPHEIAPDLEKVEVAFEVVDTNRYGDLVVEWNGKEIYRGRSPTKQHKIEVAEDYVKTNNKLRIYCEGPGWYFWASTIYQIKDLRLSAIHGKAKIVPFRLTAEEVQSFGRGEVSFLTTDKAGRNLTIKVNGQTIYSKYPQTQDKAVFTYPDTGLQSGINMLVFTGEGGTFKVQEAKLEIYVLGNRMMKSRTFYLTEEQQKSMAAGKAALFLDFNAETVPANGELKITLNSKELELGKVLHGWNRARLADAAEGRNTLEFSGTGTWNIEMAAVGMEAKPG